MLGTTPACIKKSMGDTWQWKIVHSIGNSTAYYDMGTTSHTIYTIGNEPLAPWNNTANNPKNAWKKALDFIVDNASCNNLSADFAILGSLTNYLFSSHNLIYDTQSGMSSYATNQRCAIFYLSSYIDKSFGNVINCYDQAGAICILGRLIGIGILYHYSEPFGYINPTYLVGIREQCNNPFFDNLLNCMVGYDDVEPDRTFFGNHAFTSFNGYVFDACAGPQLGFNNIQQYLESTIDQNTEKERNRAGTIYDITTYQVQDIR